MGGSIWRDNNVEASSSDRIDFDTGASVPDALTRLGGSTITVLSGLAFLKKPKGQMNKIQDTFVKGMQLRIIGYVNDTTGAGAPDTSKVWGMEAKTVITTFPQGRFGFRIDEFPAFNVRPNANRGCQMGDLKWTMLSDSKYTASFEMDLFFQANVTGLNSPTFNWDTT